MVLWPHGDAYSIWLCASRIHDKCLSSCSYRNFFISPHSQWELWRIQDTLAIFVEEGVVWWFLRLRSRQYSTTGLGRRYACNDSSWNLCLNVCEWQPENGEGVGAWGSRTCEIVRLYSCQFRRFPAIFDASYQNRLALRLVPTLFIGNGHLTYVWEPLLVHSSDGLPPSNTPV